jgi:hypothetical protein
MQYACAVLYCHLWPLWQYHIYRHYLINGTIFGEQITDHELCVFIFSTAFVSNTCHLKKNSAIYYHKCIYWSSYPVPLSDFNETRAFWTEFRKILKYQISRKSVQWEPSCSMRTDGQTDRRDEANSRFSRFCESA